MTEHRRASFQYYPAVLSYKPYKTHQYIMVTPYLKPNTVNDLDTFKLVNKTLLSGNIVSVKQLDRETAEVTLYNTILRVKQVIVKPRYKYENIVNANIGMFRKGIAYFGCTNNMIRAEHIGMT